MTIRIVGYRKFQAMVSTENRRTMRIVEATLYIA
jgi:hypothetical protein